jgi:hypothetical protein
MNLSAWEGVDNPRGAMAAAFEGMAIARRRRLAGWTGAFAGNWADGAFWVGEWDGILELAAELDAEGLLPADESANIFGPVYMIRASRGAIGEATAAVERIVGPHRDDFQAGRSYDEMRAYLAFVGGDLPAMRDHATRLIGPSMMYEHDAIPAARASLWLHDPVGVREAIAGRGASAGRASNLRFAALRAGLAALEGRIDEARAGYRAAEAGLRELDIRFELGVATLEHAVFLAGDESADDAAAEARAIFEALGATALLALVPERVTA